MKIILSFLYLKAMSQLSPWTCFRVSCGCNYPKQRDSE